MNILVIGSGGREHALCWAIRRSPLCDSLYCAPGNAGIAGMATLVPLAVEDLDGIVAFARDHGIGLVVVGPEVPLVLGLVDRLEAAGIKAFGPSAAAARLEGSKGFMKDMVARCAIPTAAYGRFTDAGSAREFIRARGAPIVVKTDGLAAGKGVVVAQSVEEALAAVDQMMGDKIFGAAGDELVIEEFLAGEEVSPWPPPRTIKGWATATPAPTPAAWAPIRRRRWPPPRSKPRSWNAASCRWCGG